MKQLWNYLWKIKLMRLLFRKWIQLSSHEIIMEPLMKVIFVNYRNVDLWNLYRYSVEVCFLLFSSYRKSELKIKTKKQDTIFYIWNTLMNGFFENRIYISMASGIGIERRHVFCFSVATKCLNSKFKKHFER